MSPLSYKSAGVDVRLASDALSCVRRFAAETHQPGVVGEIGDFAGLFNSALSNFGGLQDPVLVATTDGVGTKVLLAQLLERHDVVGRDVTHHCINDAAVLGAEPLFFLDYYATGRLEPDVYTTVVRAIADACAEYKCVLLGGETAEMPGVYADGVYDLAGFLVGVVEDRKRLGRHLVSAGDHLVGLPSNGLHTNGYTLARAICEQQAAAEGMTLREWLSTARVELAGSPGDALLATHRCYLHEIRALRSALAGDSGGKSGLHAVAHVTGGGWEGNIPRVLPDGHGVVVDTHAWQRPAIFGFLMRAGEISEEAAFETWNMGIGLVAIVAEDDLERALGAVEGSVRLGRVELTSWRRRVRFA